MRQPAVVSDAPASTTRRSTYRTSHGVSVELMCSFTRTVFEPLATRRVPIGKFEDAKFKLKGSIQCKRGKKTFKKKSIAISHDSSKKIKTLHETDVRGKYRLATYTSKAGGRPLVCKGRIEADPGTISHALVEGTRQQRPSDFVADLLKR